MYSIPSSKTDHPSPKPLHPQAHLPVPATSIPLQLQTVTRQMLTQNLANAVPTSASVLPHLQKQIGNQAIAQMVLKSTTAAHSLPSVPIQRQLIIENQKITPAQLIQFFEKVNLKYTILIARQKHKVDIQSFTALLQQEIDEHDQTISFVTDEAVAKQLIYQIASTVLQKLALNPVLNKEEEDTDLLYDSVSEPVTKEDVMPRLQMLKGQLDIFPPSMKSKWISYYQIVWLSKSSQPIALEQHAVTQTLDEMDNYLSQYIVQIKKQLDAATKRVESDPLLAIVAPQLSVYLNEFKYVKKELISQTFSLKKVNDNLLFLERRLNGLYADMIEMNPEPVVYLHSTAGAIDDSYISMVHNNWNAGRTSPKATAAKHIHVNGYSENVIYTMQNSNKHLYIHGYVDWHLDSKMSGSEQTKTSAIEAYDQNLSLFSIYMKYEEEWIPQQEWYEKAAAKYLATFPAWT